MNLLLCTTACLLLSFARQDSVEAQRAPQNIAELEQRITEVLTRAKTPGIGLTIVSRDSVLYTGARGLARVQPPLAATESTLFRIGSTSKTFVALAAMQLVREGRLSLDDPIDRHLPGFYHENPWHEQDPVRVVHLLEHTSGWDDNSLKAYASSDPTPLTLSQGLALDSSTRVSRWRPGTRYAYSNTGPAVVALIIERITDATFEEVVQQRLFGPMGMRTATYLRPDSASVPVASLYRSDGRTPYPYWHLFARPVGAINASALDMSRHLLLLLNRGTINGTELLPGAAIERMERTEASLKGRAGLYVGYGLHLYRMADTAGFVWTGHNGGMEGGLSDLSYLADHGVGYAFQINSSNGQAYAEIQQLVRSFITKDLTASRPPPAGRIPESIRATYAGWYLMDAPRTQRLQVLNQLVAVTKLTFESDTQATVAPLLGGRRSLMPVDSVRLRGEGEALATVALVNDARNGRDIAIEGFGSTLSGSWVQVSAARALLPALFVALWTAAIVMSLLAMVVGGLRRVARSAAGEAAAPQLRSTAQLWRVAAMASLAIALHGALLVYGVTSNLAGLGSLSLLSGTAWLLGLVYGAIAVWSVMLLLRSRASAQTPVDGTTWRQALSLWAARAVLALHVIGAAYLIASAHLGWRTWT